VQTLADFSSDPFTQSSNVNVGDVLDDRCAMVLINFETLKIILFLWLLPLFKSVLAISFVIRFANNLNLLN